MDKLNSTLNYMLHTRANKERQYLNRDHIKATDARRSAEYAGKKAGIIVDGYRLWDGPRAV